MTNKIGDEECISLALSFYGYGVIVARIYEEAINKLCKKDSNKKCSYNSLLFIRGETFLTYRMILEISISILLLYWEFC